MCTIRYVDSYQIVDHMYTHSFGICSYLSSPVLMKRARARFTFLMCVAHANKSSTYARRTIWLEKKLYALKFFELCMCMCLCLFAAVFRCITHFLVHFAAGATTAAAVTALPSFYLYTFRMNAFSTLYTFRIVLHVVLLICFAFVDYSFTMHFSLFSVVCSHHFRFSDASMPIQDHR